MSRLSRAKVAAVDAASGRRRAERSLKIAGSRVGTKKRDMRWEVDGQIWASRFEYEVFSKLTAKGYNVQRTRSPEDSLAYTSPVRQGRCAVCHSDAVVTERSYTPDILVSSRSSSGKASFYYIEAKGYLRADRRTLLRSFRKSRPDIDLRLVIQQDYKVGKSTLSGWATKYLKVPVHVWNGDIPEDWK